MTFRKSPSQIYFETMFLGPKGKPFEGLPKKTYEERKLSGTEAGEIRAALKDEVMPYYYKALLSLVESFPAINNHNYSWATVKLYYSVYYSCRAYLACKGTAIFRGERKLFYVKARENEYIKKCQEHTDHKGTMYTLKTLYNSQDLLQHNTIDNMLTYEWMMMRREEINYKDIDFHDPDSPDFWYNIQNDVKNEGIEHVVKNLIEDEWLFCFQSEYGVLGIPLKRLMLTVNEIRLAGINCFMEQNKKEFVEQYLQSFDETVKRALLVWKR